MNWRRLSDTLLETECKTFQIGRAPVHCGRITYRAWRRKTNTILLAMDADDTPEDRKRAVSRCKEVCEAAAV